MPFRNSHNAIFFVFDHLQQAGLVHGIFSRHGGVSPAPWGSLNTGSRVGDSAENVGENLAIAARSLNRDPGTLIGVRQVHGCAVFTAGDPVGGVQVAHGFTAFVSKEGTAVPEADAIITQNPRATLFMRFADCVPILLYDPVRKAAGIAHAGWRGTVKQVAAKAVEQLTAQFGSAPGDILAGIGPSICVDHYEVGRNVVDEATAVFGEKASMILRRKNGAAFFDLWAANRIILEQAGVKQIEMSSQCTIENLENWYSHRGEKGRTGRFAAIVGL